MAVLTDLPHSAIAHVLNQYEVGGLATFRPATDGIENTNYFVETHAANDSQRKYVLTLIEEAGNDRAQRKSMFAILARSRAEGLPVPSVVATRDGKLEGELGGKPVLLCQCLPGSHVVHPATDQCAALGRFLARFHLANDDGVEARPYLRDSTWLEAKTNNVRKQIAWPDQQVLIEALSTVQALLSRRDTRALPQGVIHGDLFRDNALFNEYGLTGVVDFHFAGRGYWLYDISVTLNDWCRDVDKLHEERVFALLRAYHSIRALTIEESWFLPTFLLYAALAYWLSRLEIAVQKNLPAGYPVKDPGELGALVKAHLYKPFRVTLDSLMA